MNWISAALSAAALSLILTGVWTPAAAASPKSYNASPELARKMTSDLLAARDDTAKGKAAGEAIAARAPHAIRGGQLQCLIGLTGPASADLLAVCADAGLTVVGTNNFEKIGVYHLVVRCDDPAQLESVALRDDVRLIRSEPLAVKAAGSVLAQSDASLDGPAARAAFSVDGSGVRVGVLSDSFNQTLGGTISGGLLNGSDPQDSGDLPADIRIVDGGPGGGSDEGAGMAELIYDIAPGCDIAFASAFSGYSAFAANITALRTDATHPSQVIVDDVIYFGEPMYQDGPIAIAARECGLNGVPFFSAAGNFAASAHEEAFFDANVTDDTASLPSGNDLHDFGAAKGQASNTHLQIAIPNNGSVTVTLHWDEPYGGALGGGPGAEADLDLYLVNSTTLPITGGMILKSSVDVQGTVGSPAGEPIEVFNHLNSTGSTQMAYIVVEHFDGREPVNLHLLVNFGGAGGAVFDDTLIGDRTLFGHAAAENVIAVGAIHYVEIDTAGNNVAPPGVLNVEAFSALGGDLPIWFSDDGNTRYVSPDTRQKPEIIAPDGANTTFFGQDTNFDADTDPEFFGTSAAAPHAAAVAALMVEKNFQLGPAEIYSIMKSAAIDAESPGVDDLSGHGLINALNVLNATPDPSNADTNWALYE